MVNMNKLKKFLKDVVIDADTIVVNGVEYRGHELLQLMQELYHIEGYYEFVKGKLVHVVPSEFDKGDGMSVHVMLRWAEGGVLLPEEGEKYLKEREAERIKKASGDEPITLKDFLDK